MKKYELNGLGGDWVYEGNTQEEAQAEYLRQFLGGGEGDYSIEQYEKEAEQVGVDSEMSWKEVEECKECKEYFPPFESAEDKRYKLNAQGFCERCQDFKQFLERFEE